MFLTKNAEGLKYYEVKKGYYDDEEWSNDPKEINDMLKELNHESSKFPAEKRLPILLHQSDLRCLFKAGEDFYFWWVLPGNLCRIVAPTDIVAILMLLRKDEIPEIEDITEWKALDSACVSNT